MSVCAHITIPQYKMSGVGPKPDITYNTIKAYKLHLNFIHYNIHRHSGMQFVY